MLGRAFWTIAALSVLLVGVYLGRGMLGGGERLAAVLAINGLFLGSTWWLRRT
ncbi:MAG: hypothetical protein GY913_01675 [Proteobacteria bacterium]|nr:hypothetical protein [Pseudomonadota bacterium]MCP4915609.1 hypothetical protein [Pseudomonadota bacterium]